ncbi:MAG TPA: hypothetical protein DIW77_17650, partial [Chromatiaceae bacterium]|nr:hypothetical protein [Chromatiaceae bacterium]
VEGFRGCRCRHRGLSLRIFDYDNGRDTDIEIRFSRQVIEKCLRAELGRYRDCNPKDNKKGAEG